MTTPRARRLLAATAALTLLGLGAIACSADGDSSGESSDSTAASGAADAPRSQAERGPADGGADLDATSSLASADGAKVADTAVQREEEPPTAPALIKTGNVALRSDDVATARFDVQKIVDTYAGEVAERTTEAGKDGAEARARLVIRVPAARFDDALADLEDIGELLSSNGSTEDVTTQVIDTDVRVQLQRRSIQRISVLLDRATSIRDIVSIERELSRREADLGSLEKRQSYLADQTSMATITVSIELPPVEKVNDTKEDKDDEGFVAGLKNGWDAFTTATVNLLTGLGAVLPFALLLLVLAFPARLVVRRVAARRPATADTGA